MASKESSSLVKPPGFHLFGKLRVSKCVCGVGDICIDCNGILVHFSFTGSCQLRFDNFILAHWPHVQFNGVAWFQLQLHRGIMGCSGLVSVAVARLRSDESHSVHSSVN